MGKAIQAFNIITGHSLSESEGWLLMQILKDVRQWSRTEYHKDSADDCIAYSALKAEALEAENKNSCTEPVSDGDGWIEWHGGECPVYKDSVVTVKLCDGSIVHNEWAETFAWHWIMNGTGGDICAYKILEP